MEEELLFLFSCYFIIAPILLPFYIILLTSSEPKDALMLPPLYFFSNLTTFLTPLALPSEYLDVSVGSVKTSFYYAIHVLLLLR